MRHLLCAMMPFIKLCGFGNFPLRDFRGKIKWKYNFRLHDSVVRYTAERCWVFTIERWRTKNSFSSICWFWILRLLVMLNNGPSHRYDQQHAQNIVIVYQNFSVSVVCWMVMTHNVDLVWLFFNTTFFLRNW